MTDIVEFLTARLDEDEAIARNALHSDAVHPGAWITEHHNSEYHHEPDRCHIAEDRAGRYWSVAHEVFIPNAEHMARHDPARVLADVAAKRFLVRNLAHSAEQCPPDDWPSSGDMSSAELADHARVYLQALAAAHADHPDYRPEWAS